MPAPVLQDILHQLAQAASRAGRTAPLRLLAVSKTQPASAIASLLVAGQLAFGENYVQEAAAKRNELDRLAAQARASDPDIDPGTIEWHLIGHLQSNKARDAAALFDWVQTVDRMKLVTLLNRHRRDDQPALNVLIQVNIDDEASKHGCRPEEIETLARAIRAQPRLQLRGLMVIPAPQADPDRQRPAFHAARLLFDALQRDHADTPTRVDTLSMGMSADAAIAVAEGATMVRIGSALFGPRSRTIS